MKTKQFRILFIIAMVFVSFTINYCAAQTVTPCWLIFENDMKIETIDRSIAIKPNVSIQIKHIPKGSYMITFNDQDKGDSYITIKQNNGHLIVYNGLNKIKILKNKGTIKYIQLW